MNIDLFGGIELDHIGNEVGLSRKMFPTQESDLDFRKRILAAKLSYGLRKAASDACYIPAPGDFFCYGSGAVYRCIAVGKQFIFAEYALQGEEILCDITSPWREAVPDDFLRGRLHVVLKQLEDEEIDATEALESVMKIINEVKGAE